MYRYIVIGSSNMAKYLLRIEARKLRSKGESVRDIAKKLEVSKGTVSIWVRDIILSVEQLEKLKQKKIKGGELGRLKGSLMQKQRRLDLIKRYKKEGLKRIGELSRRELMIACISLYWAEGSKKGNEMRFCNSDPKLVNLIIKCLKENFDIDEERLSARVGINEIHRNRDITVKEYWSKTTGISLSQFRKTSFKKSKVFKIYENHNNHYGTLNLTVLKSAELYYKIMGLIDGLASQGSSMVVAQHS